MRFENESTSCEEDSSGDEPVPRCSRCERFGHSVKTCFARTKHSGEPLEPSVKCARCLRTGHEEPSCYARTKFDGSPLEPFCRIKVDNPEAGVYVLLDGFGRYYVGKSNDIENRIREHKMGLGTKFLDRDLRRVPTSTHGSMDDLEAFERAETLFLMRKHGVEKVRGWLFSSPFLSEIQKADAFVQICERHDLCRRCGAAGHFASACFARHKASWCGL